jgi:DNA-binding response OmpR family regulator
MTRSILVVEDYPDLRDVIAGVLSRNGCVCECVGTAGAIAKLRANHYEAILISPRLPIASDPVLHYLAENAPGQLSRVVVMQSPDANEEEADAPDARCHLLTKPFSRDELLAQVDAAG